MKKSLRKIAKEAIIPAIVGGFFEVSISLGVQKCDVNFMEKQQSTWIEKN